MTTNKYVNDKVSTRDVDEPAIYRDAWSIADPGACNPVAVAGTLREASSALLHHIGTDGVRNHPALRLIAAQLAALYNVDSDGGSKDGAPFITQVRSFLDKIERGYVDICPVCGAYNDFPCTDGGDLRRLLDHTRRPQTMGRDHKNYGEREHA